MNFNSIDEIVSHFNLDTKEVDEVKKELKNLIKQAHPDKNNGDFRDEKEKGTYYDIQSALDFLGDIPTSISLATKKDITALTTVLKDLALARRKEVIDDIIEKKVASLTTKLQESVEIFHKRNSTPKISGIVASVIITALWAFPNIVKEHPLLSILYTYNREFTIIWLLSLFFSGILWLRIKSSEIRDEEIKRSYKLEPTQNYIFTLFISWMRTNHKNYEIRDKNCFIKFTKDDLINFLVTRYESLRRHMQGTEKLTSYEFSELIGRFDKFPKYPNDRYRGTLLGNFLPRPGEIDLEIAQLVCDLILDRLLTKGIITKLDSKKLSDVFEYEDEF